MPSNDARSARGRPWSERVTLPIAVAVTCGSLFAGVMLRTPCVSGDWSTGVQYERLCYTDVLPMYTERGLGRDRIPYLDAPNEYPVLTGAFIAVTGLPAGNAGTYFAVSMLGLAAFAVVVTWLLFRLAGWRALVFAAAPSLVVYSFVNWDLLAVALAVAATFSFVRRRDAASGVLLGLGAAAKLYPALFVLPFAWQRWREDDRGAAGRIVFASAAAWAAVNAPVAIVAPRGWAYFFRFNAARAADWGSLWATGCRIATGETVCASGRLVDVGSSLAFVAAAAAVVIVWSRRGLPPWTAAFGLTAAFLLANKVYSPQYSLWLLPWFVLLLPDLRLFVLFELADLAAFVTHFSWQGRVAGFGGVPLGALELASLARAAALVAIVVAYVRTGAAGADARQPSIARGTRRMRSASTVS
jgi:uncharacterized membrane protein